MNSLNKYPICLTIAGVDPSGGAGVVADLKTFGAFGCYGTAAIASLTFQNTTGVFGVENQTAETVEKQIRPIFEDMTVDAVKTGMLPTAEIIAKTADLMTEFDVKDLVVDPVVRSTSGFDLIDDAALKVLVEKLFPLALIVTPNLPEAERITGLSIKNVEDIRDAGKIMLAMGAANVLIKGGHIKSDDGLATDYLFSADDETQFSAEYIETTSTHGTGCTLSSAIAASLAKGFSLKKSIKIAKEFVHRGIANSPQIGRGNSPIDHFVSVEDILKELAAIEPE